MLEDMYDCIECPDCREISPVIEEFEERCVYCGALLFEQPQRIERRYEVELKPVSWGNSVRALARVKYQGAWLNCFKVIDTGHPDHPEVEAPRLHGGHRDYPLIYFEDPNDITDLIVSVIDEYYKQMGYVTEERIGDDETD